MPSISYTASTLIKYSSVACGRRSGTFNIYYC